MKRIPGISVGALVVVVLLGAMLAGCGAEPTSPPPKLERRGAASLPTNTPRPETLSLIFGHPEDAAKLDPADVTDGESLLVTWHLYEGLTRYKPGTAEVEPALATEWATSEDGLEWTFTLREGVKFHDGTDFDADAVVWNFERWFDEANEYHFADWDFSYWAYMFQGYKPAEPAEGEEADEAEAAEAAEETAAEDEEAAPASFFTAAEAVDPLTVKLILNRPNAPLLQTLAMGNFGFSSPAAVQLAGDSYGTPDGDPIAAGTGPYMVEEWVVNDKITVVAFPDYWGEQPATPEIVFRVIPDGTARYLSLASGEIDGMNQVNPEDIESAQGNDEVQVVFEPANNVGYLGFNQAKAPWDNLDCRLAVAHAIDKQGIVDALYAGDAEPAAQMMPPSLWGFNPDIEDYPFDMEEAAAAMERCLETEAMPDEVVFYVPPIQRFYYPKPKELGEQIQAALSELGVNAQIQSPDWRNVWLPDVREGKHDIFLLGWGGDNGDPDNFLCQFFCGGDASFNGDGEGNPLPPDEELDALLREAATLSDQAARRELYEQANARIHELVPAVPIVNRTPPLIFRSNTVGYTPSPIQTILTGVEKE